MIKIISIGILLMILSSSCSKEYHVSVTGSDTNKGSAASPFKTIFAAAEIAQPGDIITVHEGVYRERINPPRGGSSENERIVYQTAQGENVSIRGSEKITGWTKVDNDAWIVKIDNEFLGISIRSLI